MSVWLAIPAAVAVAAGIIIVPALMVEDITGHLRHWRDGHS